MSPSPSKTRFLKSFSDPAALPTDGLPQVVFLGRSNAGKSTLINALTGVEGLANVSASPGRTRLINLFVVDNKYHLVDLPGYGFAKGSKEDREKLTELIRGYLHGSALLRFAVVIVDSRLGPTDSDREMIHSLFELGVPFLLVANKTDKLAHGELQKVMTDMQTDYPGVTIIAHSVVTRTGQNEIRDAIKHVLTVGAS